MPASDYVLWLAGTMFRRSVGTLPRLSVPQCGRDRRRSVQESASQSSLHAQAADARVYLVEIVVELAEQNAEIEV
ncbi:MAG: hypothetical protein JWR89_1293 [Tardiphaga sp.]|nr:hypothetical protein [Tardiphaga sp.]